MRLSLCLVSLFLGLSYCLPTRNTKLDTEWELFKSTHGRNYTKEEDTFRRKVWEQNLKLIEEHNHQYKVGKQSYYLEMNAFGDKTDEEINVLMSRPITQRTRRHTKTQGYSPSLKPTVDEKKIPWKNFRTSLFQMGRRTVSQAQTSAQGPWGKNLAGRSDMSQKKRPSLGLCHLPQRHRFLGGGSLEAALVSVQSNNYFKYGHRPEGVGCDSPLCGGAPGLDTPWQALIEAVATVGPLSVAMHATQSFRFYRGGFFSDPSCDPNLLNHAVVLIGYGEEESNNNLMKLEENSCRKYWIIKNSFGEAWGENGYMRLARTGNNHCGIASDSVYPVV
uniref:Cathepsin propeptide inhibitor domain-containing protein n=1 Tax=Sarcophilus harrisii TaxID=9305 RepID=G3VJ29_SARHA